MSDIAQWLMVASVVGISALYMLGRVVPRWRVGVAQHLQLARYPRWINGVGARLGSGGGCGSCDTCGSCAPKKESPVGVSAEHTH
jgi:hypothetical protein